MKHLLGKILVISAILVLFSVPVYAQDTEQTPTATEYAANSEPVKPSLSVTVGKASGKPELSWGEDAHAVKFQIYRATSKSGKYSKIKELTGNRYVDTSASAAKKYYYKIRAIAEDGSKSVYSAVKYCTAKLSAPNVAISMVRSTGKIKLSWPKVSGRKEYAIYRATGANGEWKKIKTTTSTSYTDSSVKAGKVYYYKVKALHSKSSYHSSYSAVVSQPCYLATPSVAQSNTKAGFVQLSWKEVQGAMQYTIFRAPAGTNDYEPYATVTKTTYVDKQMQVGESFTYQVQAIFSKEAFHSSKSKAVTGTRKLGAPDVTGKATKTSEIRLSWDALPYAANYTVSRATSKNGTYKVLKTLKAVEDQASYTFVDSNVSTGKKYYYKVTAIDKNKNAKRASDVVCVTGAISAPEIKTTASVTASSIRISWKKVTGASGYYIYRRKTDSKDSWKKIATVSSSKTSYTSSGVKGVYDYCVSAYKTVSKTKYAGIKSSPITVRTLAPSASASVTKGSGEWTNLVTWNKVSGATGYEIYRKTTTGKTWEYLATIDPAGEYIDKDIEHFREQYLVYKVRAIYKHGKTTSYGPYQETRNSCGGRWPSPSETETEVVDTGFGEYRFDSYLDQLAAAQKKYELRVPGFSPSAYGPFEANHLQEPTYRLYSDGVYRGTPAEEDGIATILLTGDLMCQTRQQEVAAKNGTFDFRENFYYTTGMFAAADFVVGNLECTLSESAALMMEQAKVTDGLVYPNPDSDTVITDIPKGDNSIHCNAPSTYLDALRYAGFDLLITANNHCMDTGLQGLFQTIAHLDQYGFLHTGTFLDKTEPRFVLAEIDGIRVAFLSYTTDFNYKHTNLTRAGQDIFLSEYRAERVIQDVQAAKASGAEFIIAYNHWGEEYTEQPNNAQITYAQQMADAGVDYIIGSHPHALQPYDVLTARDGRSVPVIYSIGNFVSHMTKIVSKEIAVVQLQLIRDSNGNIRILDEGVIPCRTFQTFLGKNYTTIPITEPYSNGRKSKYFSEAYGHIAQAIGKKLKMLGTAPSP